MSIRTYVYDDLDANERVEILKRPRVDFTSILGTVAPIVDAVAERGDAAVAEFTAKFDGVDLGDDVVVKVSDLPDPELDEAGKLARLTELRSFLRECQDPNPPKTSKPYWKEQCNSHNIKYCGAPQGKKKDWKDGNGVRIPTKIITFQTLACSSTERCMMEMMDLDAPGDAEDTSVPVVHYTAKVIADQRARDLARFAHTAVAFCAELSAAPDLLIQLHRYRRR